jgi:hypothetical protein
MRLLSILLLSLAFHPASSQTDGSRWHAAVGLSESTLSFQQNGAGALAIPIRYDFLNLHNSSFSLGTNIKIGSEDEYGVSFPLILLLIALLGGSGNNLDLSSLGSSNSNPTSNYSVKFFSDLPVLLHYNWGRGTARGADQRFGWFAGGGLSYTITGVTINSHGHAATATFPGWTTELGIRTGNHTQLSFSTTIRMQSTVGPIQHPFLFGLTLAFSAREY